MIGTLNELGAAWWSWMAPLLWQVALLAALVWAMDLVLRRRGWPQVRYALWLLVLVRLLLPPTFSLPSSVSARVIEACEPLAAVAPPALSLAEMESAGAEPAPAASEVPPIAIHPGVAVGPAETSREPDPGVSLQAWAMLLSSVVSLAFFGWLIVRVRRLRREVLADARSGAPPGWIRELLKRCAEKLKVRRPPRLVITERVRAAGVFGILRPLLLLPRRPCDMPRDQMEHVVLHELAHIKRGDLVVNAVQTLLHIVFWFHPLVWLAGRRLRHLRELCCDATVSTVLRERTSEYRGTLMHAARGMVAGQSGAALGLLGLFESASRLRQRLEHLERPAWRHARLKLVVAVAAAGAMLACIVPMAVVEAEQDAKPKDDKPRPAPVTIRRLKGQELREARAARDRADRLRADYEAPRMGPFPDKHDEAAFAEVVAAYKEVMEKYPGTDIAAYCQLRLTGLYQFRRDYDRATELLKGLARRYAGTEHETEAYFSLGLLHLQARHDPAAALPWFAKVVAPPGAREDGTVPEKNYSPAHGLYISAQQQLAKCEIRLGKPDEAARRYEALARRYPQYAKSFAHALRFQVRSALSGRTLADIRPVLSAWQQEDRQKREKERLEAERKRWGKAVNGLRAGIAITPSALRVGDPFVIDIKVENVSDKATHLYYVSLYPAKRLVIRNERGEICKCQETVLRYHWPHPKTFYHLIKPGGVFRAQIKGRIACKFVWAADLPAKGADRPILICSQDAAHDIGKPGKFTARLHLAADEKIVAQGKEFGLEPVWTGELDSNTVAFSVRRMTREELDKVIQSLRAGTEEKQKEAIKVVGANADRHAVPALMEILTKGPGPLARPAANALVGIQDTSVIPDLLALYKLLARYRRDDPHQFLPLILRTIGALEPDRRKTADLFIGILKSDAPVIARVCAAQELLHRDHPQRLAALVEAIRDKEPRLRMAVARVLGSLASQVPAAAKPKFTAPLVECLRADADSTVRKIAAGALGVSGDRSAAPALVAALKDPDPYVAVSAAIPLGRLAGPEAIPALEAFAKAAKHKRHAAAAQQAIKFIRQRARGGER